MELHRSSGRAGRGLALSLTTVAMWGVLPLGLKAALTVTDATTIVWFRFLVSAVIVGVLLAARGSLPGLRGLTRGGRWLLGAAILGLGGNYIAYMLGLERTTAAASQVVIQLSPPLLGLGGILVFRERFSRVQWIGFGVLLLGLASFVLAQAPAEEGPGGVEDTYWLGAAWIVVAALLWAGYGLAQKQLLVQLGSQGIMLSVYVACAVGFWPLAEPSSLVELDAVEWGFLLFCGLNTAIAYGAFSEALAHWEASRVSAVLALTPLATIGATAVASRLVPAWVAAEPIRPLGLAGAVLVVAGSMATALGRR